MYKTFFFEVFAAIFTGELRNVIFSELVKGFVQNGPKRRRSGAHGGNLTGGGGDQ